MKRLTKTEDPQAEQRTQDLIAHVDKRISECKKWDRLEACWGCGKPMGAPDHYCAIKDFQFWLAKLFHSCEDCMEDAMKREEEKKSVRWRIFEAYNKAPKPDGKAICPHCKRETVWAFDGKRFRPVICDLCMERYERWENEREKIHNDRIGREKEEF